MAAEQPETDSERHRNAVIEIADERALVGHGSSSVAEYVRAYFADTPVLARIAWCESKFEHTEADGSVLRGKVTPADVGVMQINEYYHGKTAKILDIDLHSLDGNLAYARYLYEREGTTPWNASRHCWADTNRIAHK